MKRDELLILLAFLLFIQGYLLENVFPALLAFSLITYLIYLRLEFNPKVEGERWINTKLREGFKAISKLKLRNLTDKKVKVKVIENLPQGFKVELPPTVILNEGEEKTLEYSIIPVRGTYKMRGPTLRVMDARELYYSDITVDSEIELEVYPSIDAIKEEFRVDTAKRALLGLQTTEVESLREYQPGDDIKHIEWKATARLSKLIIKEFLKELEGDVYIILDAGKEMRKGGKIKYATTLAIQLAQALKDYKVGLIVYDDFSVKCKVEPSREIEKIVRSLDITPLYSKLFGVKLPEISLKLSKESREFLKRVLPVIKGRRSFVTGLIEAVSSLPSSAFLIFIADITSHTNELMKVLSELRGKYRIILLTPNPILFYDESKLDKRTLLWLYKRYLEREEIIKRFNKIVPTIDVGPSDLLELIKPEIDKIIRY